MKRDVFGFLKKCVELLRKFLPSDELAEVEKEYVNLTENEAEKRKSYAEYMRKYRKNYVNLTRKSYAENVNLTAPETCEIGSKTAFLPENGQDSARLGEGGLGGGVYLNLNNSTNNIVTGNGTNGALPNNDVTGTIIYLKEKNTKKRKENPREKLSGDFEIFWKAYPRKVGKQAALRKFLAAFKVNGGLTLAALLEAVEAQKESAQWLKDGGQFIPYPATWLGRGQWEDLAEAKAAEAAPAPKPPPREILSGVELPPYGEWVRLGSDKYSFASRLNVSAKDVEDEISRRRKEGAL